MSISTSITIIGGGLAGSEAAWQLARRGIRVRLHEMRPAKLIFGAGLESSTSLFPAPNDPAYQ